MPDVPHWFSGLDDAIRQIEALPFPWVGRVELEAVLGIGRRRAQQILQPLVSLRIGRNGLAERERVIEHLRRLASGAAADTETHRRRRFAQILADLNAQATKPKVLVEAPAEVQHQGLADLPAGIELRPGKITVSGFATPEQAKQLLLALVMAIGNDPDRFDSAITIPDDR